MGFGISGGVIKVYSKKDLPESCRHGEPNTRYDYIDFNGKIIRQVETNANGQPIERQSWTNIRSKHWKEVAKAPNAQDYENVAKGNIEHMHQGLAPIGSDGKSMVLHHPYGRQDENIYIVEERTQSEHIAFHSENGYYFYNGKWHHTSYASYLGGK